MDYYTVDLRGQHTVEYYIIYVWVQHWITILEWLFDAVVALLAHFMRANKKKCYRCTEKSGILFSEIPKNVKKNAHHP